MLQKIINNIKSKPAHIRKSITFFVSFSITGVIGFFWLISFLNYSSEILLAKPTVESPVKFFEKMGSLIGESYANARLKIKKDSSFGTLASSTDTTVNSNEYLYNNVASSTASSTDIVNIVETISTASVSTSSSVYLEDILTTKKQDNQGIKATTSNEVLIQ